MTVLRTTISGALLLSACGGAETSGGTFFTTSGGGAAPATVSPIEELRNEAARLDAAVVGLTYTSASVLPTTGSATYSGLATFGFVIESAGGIGVGGDLEMRFGFEDGSVTGEIDNFYSRNGDAREGELTLSNGFLIDSGGTAVVGAELTGEVDLLGGTPLELTGGLLGAMAGPDGEFVVGQTAVEYQLETLPTGSATFEGVFIVERD